MYDIDLKNVKKSGTSFLLFVIIGLLFAGIGSAMFLSEKIKKSKMDSEVEAYDVEIDSHMSDGSTMYTPIHHYRVDGVEYTCTGGGSTSSITSSMEDPTVYYNSSNPRECTTDYAGSTGGLFFIAFGGLGGLCAAIGIKKIIDSRKKIKMVKYLVNNGMLVKNLPYHMEDTGTEINHRRIRRPVVNYPLPSGNTITLRGEGRFDYKERDADGFVDLLIDPNDFNNYFIDFEINRISGNLDSDYYKPTQEEQARMQNNPNVSQFNNSNFQYNNPYGPQNNNNNNNPYVR